MPGREGGSNDDACAGAGQILDKKKSLSEELTVQRRKNKHMLEQTYVSLPNKMTQVRSSKQAKGFLLLSIKKHKENQLIPAGGDWRGGTEGMKNIPANLLMTNIL